MARALVKSTKFDLFFYHRSIYARVVSISKWRANIPIYRKELASAYTLTKVYLSNLFHKKPLNVHQRCLCSRVQPRRLCWEGSPHEILLKKLETCLKNHQVEEAWEVYTDFNRLYGFPETNILSRLLKELSHSHEPIWLQRACDIVLALTNEKSNLLHVDLLYILSLSLARAQMPLPASMILRIMIEKQILPSRYSLGPIFIHMVKKEMGAYLASNILIQICCYLIKPDTLIFNLVLDACLSYKLSFKAQQIIELMSQVGVIGDAHTIIIIARIHEINGQRDEIKKFKNCVDQVAVSLSHHYCHFYDNLMSLHFKFNDIDAVSKLILDIISFKEFVCKGPQKPFVISIGSRNLKIGLKLHVLPHLLQKDSLLNLERNGELVMHKNGRLVICNKAIAKLVIHYKRNGRISELSELLFRFQMEKGLVESNNLSFDVIDACIDMGWLETAHDILDDFEQKANILSSGSYKSLLSAYNKGGKHREAQAFMKQIAKSVLIISDETGVFKDEVRKSGLTKFMVKEMREGEKSSSLIYELNSSIYFFMKAKMIDDALKTYRSMQKMNVHPNVATFIYMVMGYSSLEMYREITFLWGDIKRISDNLLINRDLYEVLLINFLKGGYFERVMEVIDCMKKNGMCPDKWFYRNEFLTMHKDLYINLKSSNAKTEAQRKRLEHVRAFRKWTGID